MITLKFKTRSGAIQEIPVERLLEVDGKPYVENTSGDHSHCAERWAYVSGRIDELEKMLTPAYAGEVPNSTLAS